jgi:uncharacterized Zn finger protein
METIIFKVQGSQPEPYTIEVTLDPFTISCTCTAALMGMLCKHRLNIINCYIDDIVEGPDNAEEVLRAIYDVVRNSDFSKKLDKYNELKEIQKYTEVASEEQFKKYRKAVTRHTLGKVKSDKEVLKSKKALETSIQEVIDNAAEVEAVLHVLQTVFIRPPTPDVSKMAQDALGD